MRVFAMTIYMYFNVYCAVHVLHHWLKRLPCTECFQHSRNSISCSDFSVSNAWDRSLVTNS